jgi:excisionase family DNA binding protein
MSAQSDQGPTYLTVAEAAEMMRVSDRTIYRWIREKRLKCFRVCNVTRIEEKDLYAFIAEYTTEIEDEDKD